MKDTAIQWTDATWNVARGCTKVDEDCKFCYMYRDSMDNTRYNPMDVVRTKTVFDFPLKYKEKESKVWSGRPLLFTSSLTDFFHPAIDSYRHEAWEIIRKCPHLIFQILTKRPERITEHLPEFWEEIRGRVWLGTSVGSQQGIHRAIDLIKLRNKADILFLSIEPLYGEVNFRWSHYPPTNEQRKINFQGKPSLTVSQHELLLNINWLIVGGESGNDTGKYRYRPCNIKWIQKLVTDGKEAGCAVFVKQLGTHLSKELKMSDRHGGNISEFPEHLMIREFPNENKNQRQLQTV